MAKRSSANKKRGNREPDARHPYPGNLDEDLELLLAWRRKRADKCKTTLRETAARKRFEKWQREKWESGLLQAVPQKLYLEMAGIRRNRAIEDAGEAGLPIGESINLYQFLPAVHRYIAETSRKLAAAELDGELGGTGSPALERYRLARAKREELSLERDRNEWIRREDVHEALGRFASLLRAAGENLQRKYGAEAQDVIDEAMKDAVGWVEQRLTADNRE